MLKEFTPGNITRGHPRYRSRQAHRFEIAKSDLDFGMLRNTTYENQNKRNLRGCSKYLSQMSQPSTTKSFFFAGLHAYDATQDALLTAHVRARNRLYPTFFHCHQQFNADMTLFKNRWSKCCQSSHFFDSSWMDVRYEIITNWLIFGSMDGLITTLLLQHMMKRKLACPHQNSILMKSHF